MTKKHYKYAVLADLHWGAINPYDFSMELHSGLLASKELDDVDGIIIAGDLFDTKETFNSEVVDQVHEFLLHLCWILTTSNTNNGTLPTLYLLEGTRTHDNNQLSMMQNMIERPFSFESMSTNSIMKYRDVIWIPNAQVFEIPEPEFDKSLNESGHRILFLPEEYVADQESYYKELFDVPDKYYDLIIGHGMIDKIWYAKDAQDNYTELNHYLHAPVFNLETLQRIGKKVYFGHVHNHKVWDNFAYVGPYTKWEFGKEKEVPGFYIVNINDDGSVTDEFIPNTMAREYPSIIIGIDKDTNLETINDMIDKKIANVYEHNTVFEIPDVYGPIDKIAKVRMIVNIDSTLPTYNSMYDFIISKVGSMESVKLVMRPYNQSTEDNTSEDIEVSEVDYIMDKSIDISDKIAQFIKKNTGKDISIDRIKEYLSASTH